MEKNTNKTLIILGDFKLLENNINQYSFPPYIDKDILEIRIKDLLEGSLKSGNVHIIADPIISNNKELEKILHSFSENDGVYLSFSDYKKAFYSDFKIENANILFAGDFSQSDFWEHYLYIEKEYGHKNNINLVQGLKAIKADNITTYEPSMYKYRDLNKELSAIYKKADNKIIALSDSYCSEYDHFKIIRNNPYEFNSILFDFEMELSQFKNKLKDSDKKNINFTPNCSIRFLNWYEYGQDDHNEDQNIKRIKDYILREKLIYSEFLSKTNIVPANIHEKFLSKIDLIIKKTEERMTYSAYKLPLLNEPIHLGGKIFLDSAISDQSVINNVLNDGNVLIDYYGLIVDLSDLREDFKDYIDLTNESGHLKKTINDTLKDVKLENIPPIFEDILEKGLSPDEAFHNIREITCQNFIDSVTMKNKETLGSDTLKNNNNESKNKERKFKK